MGSYLAICALPKQQRQKAEEANRALHSTLSGFLAVWQCVPMPTSAITKGMGFTSTILAISLMSCFFNWDTSCPPILGAAQTCAAGQQSDTQWLSTHHKQKKIISADPLHYSPCCWQLQSYWHLGNLKSNLHLVFWHSLQRSDPKQVCSDEFVCLFVAQIVGRFDSGFFFLFNLVKKNQSMSCDDLENDCARKKNMHAIAWMKKKYKWMLKWQKNFPNN